MLTAYLMRKSGAYRPPREDVGVYCIIIIGLTAQMIAPLPSSHPSLDIFLDEPPLPLGPFQELLAPSPAAGSSTVHCIRCLTLSYFYDVYYMLTYAAGDSCMENSIDWPICRRHASLTGSLAPLAASRECGSDAPFRFGHRSAMWCDEHDQRLQGGAFTAISKRLGPGFTAWCR